jgi:hypothetical protein
MKSIFSIIIMLTPFAIISQNVGINATGSAPDASAMLDVTSTNKGLLIPRIALTANNVAAPVTSPLTSLLVYNTATASSGATAVTPGYYYWDGAKWVALAGPNGRDWSLDGNAGTTAGTNFLGTTDNVDLVIKVNNIQSGRVTSATNNNSFFGFEAGLNNSGTWNTYYGSQAGKASTNGGNNVGVGFGAMRNVTTGSTNVFIGNNAGAVWVSSTGNTAIGNQALQGLAAGTGVYNTAVGFAAGSGFNGTANNLSQLSGSYNTYIGYSSSGTTSSNTFTNSTAIGAFAQAGANDVIVLGSINGANTASATANVLIGRTSNFAANTEMVYTSSALQIENSSSNRNGLYIRNTGTGGSAGIGSFSQNYIGVYGTSKESFGLYVGVVGTPTANAYGSGGTTRVNASLVPLIITPGGNAGLLGTSTGATGYGAYTHNQTAAGWSAYFDGPGGAYSTGGWYQPSDLNLKMNIEDINGSLNKIMKLRAVSYNFKPEYGISEGKKIGFIAQELEKIIPEAVKEKTFASPIEYSADGTINKLSKSNRPEKIKVVETDAITPILVQAIQEQQAQIELLKKEIELLKSKTTDK